MANHRKINVYTSILTAALALGLSSAAAAQDPAHSHSVLYGDPAEHVPGEEALQEGHIAEAIQTLEAARKAEGDDPAILINLGQAYARAGQMDAAYDVLMKARHSRQEYDLQLSSGEIVSTHDAAQSALDWLHRQTETAQLDISR